MAIGHVATRGYGTGAQFAGAISQIATRGYIAGEPEAALFTSSGDAGVQVFAGTAWNAKWSETYGPDAERAKRAKREEVEEAVEVLSEAPDFDDIQFAAAKDVAKRSLVEELMSDDADRVLVMMAYAEYQDWLKRKKRRNRKAAALLLM